MKQNILNTWKAGAATPLYRSFCCQHLVLIYYWVNVVYYWISPRNAYHLSYEVEIRAAETYSKFLVLNGPDEKILEILNDELDHSRELKLAMEKI